jgi:hypothetical protein
MYKKFCGMVLNLIFGVLGGVIAGIGLITLDALIAWWTESNLWENLYFFSKMVSITDDQAYIIIFGIWAFSFLIVVGLEQIGKKTDWLRKFARSTAGSLLFVMGFMISLVGWILGIDAVFENAYAEPISFDIYIVAFLLFSSLGIAFIQAKFS